MVGVVEHDAAFLERADVALVGMLVERQQHIGLVAGAEHFARADAHLENRGAARNGRRDGHEGHHLLVAAAGQPRQEAADGLDAILRIARDANHRLGNAGDWARRRRGVVRVVSLMRGPFVQNLSQLPKSGRAAFISVRVTAAIKAYHSNLLRQHLS